MLELDVSLEQSSVCVADSSVKFVRDKSGERAKGVVAAFHRIGLPGGGSAFSRVPHLSGSRGPAEAGLEVVLRATRHVKAALSAMTVKNTDRKDARGIASCCAWGGRSGV